MSVFTKRNKYTNYESCGPCDSTARHLTSLSPGQVVDKHVVPGNDLTWGGGELANNNCESVKLYLVQ